MFVDLKWILIICALILKGNEQAQEPLLLVSVNESGTTVLSATLSWFLTRTYPSVVVTWDTVSYLSEVTYRYVGKTELTDHTIQTFSISKDLKFDQQYRFCVEGIDSHCSVEDIICSYVKISRLKKSQKDPQRYIVIGPVYSTNATVSLNLLKSVKTNESQSRKFTSYRFSWKKIEGRVGSHPGHSSQLVSHTHFVRGLVPATRYEFCVMETIRANEQEVCDIISTAEDVPGPPIADASTCYILARGTHWRCEVTWEAPIKQNGKIRGYYVSWKDEDEYTLLETAPIGAHCDPFCSNNQVLPFQPSEVCIRARTSKGTGWESCVKVEDVTRRIVAFFEPKVIVIIICTLFMYVFGFAILRWCFKCCVRSLYGILENKEHPV